jgi:hypothetical protein
MKCSKYIENKIANLWLDGHIFTIQNIQQRWPFALNVFRVEPVLRKRITMDLQEFLTGDIIINLLI